MMKKYILYLSVLMGFFFLTTGLPAAGRIDVTFVNKSGYPDNKVYLYVTGDDGSTHGYYDFNTQSYVVPRVSTITQMTRSLDQIEVGGKKTIPIPGIKGGRIYFSYQSDFDALSFDSVNGQPGYGPNDKLLYDKLEFTTNDSNQLNMNTTNVDFFSLPFTFEAVDKNTHKNVKYGYQVGRDLIFSAFSEVPAVPESQQFGNTAIYIDNLVQSNGGTTWRVIAPDKVAVPSQAQPDPASGDWNGNFKRFSFFWHDYVINQCWVPNRIITLNYNATFYTGTVNSAGDSLAWDSGGGTFSRPAYTTLPDPPPTGPNIGNNYGHVIFGGAGEFTAGSLAPIVNSAIQRGVMHLDGSEWDDSVNFYQGTNSADSPVNHYGRILHQYAINHNCYALSYDDGFGYNTSIFVDEGTEFTVTLLPLDGASRHPWIYDYNGDGTSDIGVFRESSGLWAIRGITRVYFGGTSDQPVPGDYDGNGTTDIGIFRPASGLWAARGVTRTYFGASADTPRPGDYNGDGTTEPGIFRESSGLWAIRGVTRVYFGTTGDTPVPGWYEGGMTEEIALFRPASGLWAIRNVTRAYFGGTGDTPKSGNYNGDGAWDIGIFRPASGLWAIRGLTRAYFGSASDQPVPADYRGTGADEMGIFRSSSGLWAVRGVTRVYFGGLNDFPVTR
jgi:glycosyl hydrolase family 64 (putative beta-1,3-glucanase)